MDFSWLLGILRGWKALAWWAILPIRAVAMILSIVSDLIFIAIFAGIAALYAGMIPEDKVRSVFDQVGRKFEAYALPEFHAVLHPTPAAPSAAGNGISEPPKAAGLQSGGVEALMSSHPGVGLERKDGSRE